MSAALLTAALLGVPMLAAWLVAARAVGDWRLGLGLGALAWGLWAIAVSELLSLDAPHVLGQGFGHLTRGWLVSAWAVPAAAGAVVLLRARGLISAQARAIPGRRGTWSRFDMALAATVVVCLALTLLVALVAAPNNWDSMTYHLARVQAWARLGGVTHYATNVEPQLYQPPGAELLIAQGYIISGGDRLAALVQWLAYAGCIALVASAVQALGGTRRAQIAAAALAATLPTAVMEATSTQNDLVLTFWLLLAATLASHVWADDARSARWHVGAVAAASASLGMAVSTKGTGLVFALPVAVVLATAALRRLGAARAALLAAAGVMLVAAPNLGQWSRNHETFGSFVSTGKGANDYRVADPDAASLTSNLVRNATNHLDAPIPGWNAAVNHGTRRVLGALGIDPDDPRTTFKGKPFRVGPFGPHEDHAGSLLLLVLGLWAAGATLLARANKVAGSGVQLAWLLVISGQVLLFCALVTWQNWHVRLHLPITMAIVPLVALRLAQLRSRRWLVGACCVGIAMAPVFLLYNVTRPLVGRDSILTHSRSATYFVPRPQLQAPYQEVVDLVAAAGETEAGLLTNVDDWQYPFAVLGAQRWPRVRFHEVLTAGPSARYDSRPPTDLPDAVACVGCTDQQRVKLTAAGLTLVPLEAGGERRGRGDDVSTVELWMRAASG